MRVRRIVMLCATATMLAAARAQPEDEAHRLDRLETRRLNEAAATRLRQVVKGDRAPEPAVAPPPASTPAEVALRQREEQALADWRARVAACRAGQRERC